MAQKRRTERRLGRGVSLLPSLWERVERVADIQGKSCSEVIEDVIVLHLPPLAERGEAGQ